MFIACHSIRLWNESIFFARVDVVLQSYKERHAAKALNVFTLVAMFKFLDLYADSNFFMLSIVRHFLLAISFSVSSLDPSSLQFFQSGILSLTFFL